MKTLPLTEHSLVVRTDYSDDGAWQWLAAAIEAPVGEFRAMVTLVSDPGYAGATIESLRAVLPKARDYGLLFLVDEVSFTHPEHPILVADLTVVPCQTFRVVPSKMWSVENNLSLGNMDFSEFAESVGQDGIFRGFAE